MKNHPSSRNSLPIMPLVSALALMMILPGNAFATQQHADPEGLYSHLIAHIFFICAMLMLIVQIVKSRPEQTGWKCIGIAAVLFLFWNVDTFMVHIIRESLPGGVITKPDGHWGTSIDLTTAPARMLYIGKILDHVFLVSAIFVFLKGILAFHGKVVAEEQE